MKTAAVTVLLAALFALLFSPSASQMTLNIPGIVVPDIQAALGRAQSQGKLPESGAPPGVSVPPGVPGAPTTGANASGTNATKPGNTTSAGGRKLLANDCFYTGFAGNRFLYQFDVCPYSQGGENTRCCNRGTNFGQCIPRGLFCICGGY